MKIGMDFPLEWKEKSKEKGISLSDLLYGVVIEDLFIRLESTSFYKFILLQNEQIIGEESYKSKTKERLEFFYLKSDKKISQERTVAGQGLSKEIVHLFFDELFSCERGNEVIWDYEIEETARAFVIHLQAECLEMKVPVTVKIEELVQPPKVLKTIEVPRLLKAGKHFTYLCYSKENILSENIFEMMKKLELISDMGVYDSINNIIKDQSLSGLHIMEELQAHLEKEPKVLNIKRLEQIKAYKDYGYMRKRWQQYTKRHNAEAEEWEVVLSRILKFVEPVWNALCKNEIFFDDWMPELERFLG